MNGKLGFGVAASAFALLIACGGHTASSASGFGADADAGASPSSSSSCATPGAVHRLEDGECRQTDGAWGAEGTELAPGDCCVRCKADEVASNGHIAHCVPKDGGSAASALPVDGTACGLALYPADYAAHCQPVIDGACCTEESACASDAACAKAVDCLKRCAPPRTDACTSACFGADDGGAMEIPPTFDALATCSKSGAFDPDGGSACSYP